MLEPDLAFLQSAELGAVAGKVVRYGPFLGELRRRGQQEFVGFKRATQFVQRERTADPAELMVGHEPDDGMADFNTVLPLSGLRADGPAHLQYKGMRT